MRMKYSRIIFIIHISVFFVITLCFFSFILFSTILVIFKLLFESNHISVSPYFYIDIILASMVFYFMNIFRLETRKISIYMILLCFISIFAIFILDKFNLLLEYHEWIQRGMPQKPWM